MSVIRWAAAVIFAVCLAVAATGVREWAIEGASA